MNETPSITNLVIFKNKKYKKMTIEKPKEGKEKLTQC